MVIIYCINCGKPIEIESNFCTICGTNNNQNNNIMPQASNQTLQQQNLVLNQTSNQNVYQSNVPDNLINNQNTSQSQVKIQNVQNQSVNPQPPIINPSQSGYNSNLQSNKKNSNLKFYLLGGGLGIVIVIVLFFIVGMVLSKSVYFGSDSNAKGEEDLILDDTIKKSPYKTIIVHDRTYEGVTISSDKDANKIITEDSVKQKNKCPKEIIEIENRITEKYNIKAVNLCEMDKSFALEIENVIKTIYNDFPTSRGYLTNMSLANVPMSEGYIAAFMPVFPFASTKNEDKFAIKTQILLNTSYFLNIPRMEASVKDGSVNGHFPPNSNRYSPIAHEYGHYLSFLTMMNHYDLSSPLILNENNESIFMELIQDFNSGDFSLEIITEAYNNYKIKTNTTLSLLDFRSSISKYAVAKDNDGNYIYDETIAEAFHDYYLNGANAKDASKEIVDVLKKYL